MGLSSQKDVFLRDSRWRGVGPGLSHSRHIGDCWFLATVRLVMVTKQVAENFWEILFLFFLGGRTTRDDGHGNGAPVSVSGDG